MKMSGYFVLLKSSSRISNCALVNVVRSRRCFLGCAVLRENHAGLERTVFQVFPFNKFNRLATSRPHEFNMAPRHIKSDEGHF